MKNAFNDPKSKRLEGKEGAIYSVVFTVVDDKTLFEIFQLKGVAKSYRDMADDLEKAKRWLDERA